VDDLTLDRMALDDVGANPERLADAIHDQLGRRSGPVPVRAIARALDILEIREEPLTNIEGALLTTPERGVGSILLNTNSGRRRRRFTLSHELLHFLNPWHRPTAPDGFWCSRGDMIESDRKSHSPHRRQEAEANAFAIELLAPRTQLRSHISGGPDLCRVLAISGDFDISREAAARRYVNLHDGLVAAVFSKDGGFLYAEWHEGFPWLGLRRGQPLPSPPTHPPGHRVSPWDEAAPEDWLSGERAVDLAVQTLAQSDGYAITLLHAAESSQDDDGSEDAYDRFSRLHGHR